MGLYRIVEGSGPALVLLHPGIADSGVFDAQARAYQHRFTVVRIDLPGFGRSPIETLPIAFAREVEGVLDQLGIASAALVGNSLGGRVALELAIARPERVAALVLVAAPIPGAWSEEVRSYGDAEHDAMSRGDVDAATEANMRMWIDGPRRPIGAVDPALRRRVAGMQRHAFELQAPFWDRLDEEPLVADIAARLREVRAPTLVLVGSDDVTDLHEHAARLAAEIPGARLVTIPDAAHLPSLEQPEAFDALVLAFLDDALPGRAETSSG